MSSDSTPKDNNGEWQMPEPIFRSSEGYVPGSRREAITDELEVADPQEPVVDLDSDEVLEGGSKIFDETAMDHVRTSAQQQQAPAQASEPAQRATGGCAKSALLTIVAVGLATVGLIALAIYYLYPSSFSNGTF